MRLQHKTTLTLWKRCYEYYQVFCVTSHTCGRKLHNARHCEAIIDGVILLKYISNYVVATLGIRCYEYLYDAISKTTTTQLLRAYINHALRLDNQLCAVAVP